MEQKKTKEEKSLASRDTPIRTSRKTGNYVSDFLTAEINTGVTSPGRLPVNQSSHPGERDKDVKGRLLFSSFLFLFVNQV